jgi:hypothetical protein
VKHNKKDIWIINYNQDQSWNFYLFFIGTGV